MGKIIDFKTGKVIEEGISQEEKLLTWVKAMPEEAAQSLLGFERQCRALKDFILSTEELLRNDPNVPNDKVAEGIRVFMGIKEENDVE